MVVAPMRRISVSLGHALERCFASGTNRPFVRNPSLRFGRQEVRHADLFIDGRSVAAASAATDSIRNPATGELYATVASGGAADVDAAVQGAKDAFNSGDWSEMPARTRCRILFRVAQMVRGSLPELADMESRQTGRCLREYQAELSRVPELFEHYASYAASQGFDGRMPPLDADHVNMVWRVPLGVCGAITPWSHPLLTASKKIAVALAAGNTMVVKPPLEAPLTVLRLAEMMHAAGVPPGTLQVVPGHGQTAGAALALNPSVERVDFTGGNATGLQVARSMAESGRVRAYCAELGGNAPIIVFADTRSVDAAVDGVAFAAFLASGQTCVSGKRVLVQQSVRAEFQEKLVAKARALRLGDPMLPDTDLGPVISARQLDCIEDHVQRAIQHGAVALCGAQRPGPERCALSEGYFYEPTILAGGGCENPAFAQEIFGPVVSLTEFSSEEEAVALANTSQYGLGAGLWTEDLRRAHRVARKLRSGVMWVNCHHRSDPSSPWGGFGQSGIGRESGPEAFAEYTATKNLTIRTSDSQGSWFGKLLSD